jgi:hypothetical protein
LILFVDSILQRPYGFDFIRKTFWYCVFKFREPISIVRRNPELDEVEQRRLQEEINSRNRDLLIQQEQENSLSRQEHALEGPENSEKNINNAETNVNSLEISRLSHDNINNTSSSSAVKKDDSVQSEEILLRQN